MEENKFVKIKKITKTNKKQLMVDITVKDNENFILSNGICVSNSAMLDLNVLRLCDMLLFKEPSLLQTRFERKGIQDIFSKVGKSFSEVKEKKEHFYVFSDDFEGLVKAGLPQFWNESISKAFRKR
ncbi:hypothetical protein K8R33_03995 [archaeon]|nr:hypothetical protein [archaeon]